MRDDLAIVGFGGSSLITPLTPAAKQLLADRLETEPWQWVFGGLFVDSVNLPAVLEALDGASVRSHGGSSIVYSEGAAKASRRKAKRAHR